MNDGGAEARRCESTPDPVRAVSLVEQYRKKAKETFPGMSDEDVEAVVLRALYGMVRTGSA
jgi:hypothetical protein